MLGNTIVNVPYAGGTSRGIPISASNFYLNGVHDQASIMGRVFATDVDLTNETIIGFFSRESDSEGDALHADGGYMVGVQDASGNGALFRVAATDGFPGWAARYEHNAIMIDPANTDGNAIATAGTVDASAIRHILYGLHVDNSSGKPDITGSWYGVVRHMKALGGNALFPADFKALSDVYAPYLMQGLMLDNQGEKAQGQYYCFGSYGIGNGVSDVYFKHPFASVEFPTQGDPTKKTNQYQGKAGGLEFLIDLTAASYADISNSAYNMGSFHRFTIDASHSPLSTLLTSGLTILNGQVTLRNIGYAMSAVSFVNCKELALNDADLSGGCNFIGSADPHLITITSQADLDRIANGNFFDMTLALNIDFGDDDDHSLTFDGIKFNNVTTHINYANAGTLTVTPTNNSNVSVSSVSGGGTVNIANGFVITDAEGGTFTIKVIDTSDDSVVVAYATGTSASVSVDAGTEIRIVAWKEGCKIYLDTRTINTPVDIAIPFVPEEFVNTSLDVSGILTNMPVTVGATIVGEFQASYPAITLEQAKAVIHRVSQNENIFDYILTNNNADFADLLADRINFKLPVIQLTIDDGTLTGSAEVNIHGYFNIDAAKGINPAYVLNPKNSNNVRVEYVPVPTQVTPADIRDAMARALTPGLTTVSGSVDEKIDSFSSGAGSATATNQTTIINLLNNLNNLSEAQIQTKVSDALTAYDAATGTDVSNITAGDATAAQQSAILAAIGMIPTTPLLANDARLNNLDTAVSTRQSTTDAGTKQTALLNAISALPTLANIEGSSVLAKQATMELIEKILRNKRSLNPATGQFILYDNDGTTPLFTITLYNDVGATVPYDGTGSIHAQERLA